MSRSGEWSARPRPRGPAPLAAAVALAVVALAVVALLVAGLGGGGDDEGGPREIAKRYLEAWTRGDDRDAAALTDEPRAAASALAANRRGLDGARVRATLATLREGERGARGRARVEWTIPRVGRFAYRVSLRVARAGDDWRVRFAPSAIHPRLDGATRLGTSVDPAPRGRILDRDGGALVTDRRVFRIGLTRRAKGGASAAIRQLDAVLDIDARALRRALRGAGPEQFVEAIALRAADYRRDGAALERIRGLTIVEDRAPLASSRAFARALLGTVGPITAEQLQRSRGRRGAGDQVGQFGLQAAFDERLAGTPGASVVVRASRAGTVVEPLLEKRPRRGRDLRTTLDRRVQSAAETALGSTGRKAALVALEPSSGDLLAVANRPVDVAFDRALEGRYPPGSTFKVVSTAALLRAGLRPSETIACPRTRTVGGRSFRNFEGEAAGTVSFAVDFAKSCNTAFVGLAGRLRRDALRDTARSFGFGERIRLPVRAASGEVPSDGDAVARAAAMIGQDRILATPLTMAGVAATIADGRWRAPRLLASDPRRAGDRLPGGEAAELRGLMRRVVTEGTGTALAGVPGEVAGKSGTAEYGGGDPPPTHAWFVALRGDLAIAVLVEGGRSGGAVAAPIAARFFQALGPS